MAKIENISFRGMTGYIQVVGHPDDDKTPFPGRYQSRSFAGRTVERFKLRAGDHWQGERSSDAPPATSVPPVAKAP